MERHLSFHPEARRRFRTGEPRPRDARRPRLRLRPVPRRARARGAQAVVAGRSRPARAVRRILGVRPGAGTSPGTARPGAGRHGFPARHRAQPERAAAGGQPADPAGQRADQRQPGQRPAERGDPRRLLPRPGTPGRPARTDERRPAAAAQRAHRSELASPPQPHRNHPQPGPAEPAALHRRTPPAGLPAIPQLARRAAAALRHHHPAPALPAGREDHQLLPRHLPAGRAGRLPGRLPGPGTVGPAPGPAAQPGGRRGRPQQPLGAPERLRQRRARATGRRDEPDARTPRTQRGARPGDPPVDARRLLRDGRRGRDPHRQPRALPVARPPLRNAGRPSLLRTARRGRPGAHPPALPARHAERRRENLRRAPRARRRQPRLLRGHGLAGPRPAGRTARLPRHRPRRQRPGRLPAAVAGNGLPRPADRPGQPQGLRGTARPGVVPRRQRRRGDRPAVPGPGPLQGSQRPLRPRHRRRPAEDRRRAPAQHPAATGQGLSPGRRRVRRAPRGQPGEQPARLAERLLAALVQPIALGGEHIDFVTPSIGIALYPRHAGDAEGLVRAADSAMYQAKRQRNRYCLYQASPEMPGQTRPVPGFRESAKVSARPPLESPYPCQP
ncbi:putative sensory box protein [Pseudomonas aeruginosa]|nr:putative sensory box protein [Pseudomonas aeruginosa]